MRHPALVSGSLALLASAASCESSPVSTTGPADASATTRPEPAETVVVIPTRSAEPRSVGAAQILVTWRGAEGAPASVTRTKEDARKRASSALESIRAQKKAFEEAVAELSDDPDAKATKGAIGNFERYAMPSAFSDAAFALEVGAVSEVVETKKGFHLIKRLR